MNAVENTAQPTSERITSGDVQPSVGARVSAKTKRMRPAVTVVAPHASKWRARPGALLSRHEASHEEQRAHADRHVDEEDPLPADVLREDPAEQDADRGARAGDRAEHAQGLVPLAPSSNVTVVIENTDGERIAAAAPWSMRAITSTSADQASPQSSENAEKAARPTMKMMRRPRMSPTRPPSSRKPPNVSA